jgi:predicted phosphohydrolase
LQNVRAVTLRALDGEWFNAVVKIAEVLSTQSIALSVVMKVNQVILILGGRGWQWSSP